MTFLQKMRWEGDTIPTGVFSDILDVENAGAKILAVYGNDYYQGSAALVERRYGRGRVLHFGVTFTCENTIHFLDYAGVLSPWKDLIHLPEDCELAIRGKEGKQYLFVLNYAWDSRKIWMKKK